jgi:NAD(P)-dependent dehydrogenase (short-subunit alcohol dehydrogenase family)
LSVTIINGGTQGLGEAVARKLVADGRSTGLVLAGRSADRGQALADELTGLGTKTVFVQCDIADVAAPRTIVDACRDAFGTVNGVVNIAARTSRANLFTDTPEHFEAMMAINARAPYFLIQAAATLMIETGATGSIVNVGSTSQYGGQTKLTSYVMSKAALAVMTKNLAFGLMRHGIRVNQVSPGWMDTESEHVTQVTYRGATADGSARQAVGGRQHDRVLPVRRLGVADRQRHRHRPDRAGRRRSADAERRRHRLALTSAQDRTRDPRGRIGSRRGTTSKGVVRCATKCCCWAGSCPASCSWGRGSAT